MPEDSLPAYVIRDIDDAKSGVRTKLRAAAEAGGFVVLVGDSSAGKTRCLYEAVQAVLPDWWLARPAGAAGVRELVGAAGRVVVWLDEIRDYLDDGLEASTIEALLDRQEPTVLVATIWPHRYAEYTRTPLSGDDDRYRSHRQVLRLAAAVDVPSAFSAAERSRADTAADDDPTLCVALASSDYGMTQTLAAAPQLVRRWEHARASDRRRGPYRWALLTAALDAYRLGARGPLSADLLREGVNGYCTDREQARAANWFEDALAYATDDTEMHGGAAALAPVGSPGGGMGHRAGYRPADYLVQHATRVRSHRAGHATGNSDDGHVPSSLWDAFVAYADRVDVRPLAEAARSRGLLRTSFRLYEAADAAGDPEAADSAAWVLSHAGRLDEAVTWWRRAAERGDKYALWHAGRALESAGRIDEAHALHRSAAEASGDSNAVQGAIESWLADGRADLALTWWWQHTPYNSSFPRVLRDAVADMEERDRTEALLWWKRAAEKGDWNSVTRAVALLREKDGTEEAVHWLRTLPEGRGRTEGTRLLEAAPVSFTGRALNG
ncbi:hypothetical protein [Frankia sp. R82]|uniref:hypothetical protein n=1 Tax=Frankia sp. R82 TaxID=2950553 RepID=UPI0020434847|nr:hypothetical protein [Frankia sp. R82]MCM3887327.1 hypothetical protein [Frankia sp. R82]